VRLESCLRSIAREDEELAAQGQQQIVIIFIFRFRRGEGDPVLIIVIDLSAIRRLMIPGSATKVKTFCP
jgi:hypothetical protein